MSELWDERQRTTNKLLRSIFAIGILEYNQCQTSKLQETANRKTVNFTFIG